MSKPEWKQGPGLGLLEEEQGAVGNDRGTGKASRAKAHSGVETKLPCISFSSNSLAQGIHGPVTPSSIPTGVI